MESLHRRRPETQSRPGQFVQAVQEVVEEVFDFIRDNEDYHECQILRPIAEADRVICFRVCREDDAGLEYGGSQGREHRGLQEGCRRAA